MFFFFVLVLLSVCYLKLLLLFLLVMLLNVDDGHNFFWFSCCFGIFVLIMLFYKLELLMLLLLFTAINISTSNYNTMRWQKIYFIFNTTQSHSQIIHMSVRPSVLFLKNNKTSLNTTCMFLYKFVFLVFCYS